MRSILKKSTVFLVVIMFLLIPFRAAATESAYAHKEEINAGKIIVDFLLMRPGGLVGTVAGAAFFIISLPVPFMGGNVKYVAKELVKDPAEFTFTRSLGSF